MQLRVYTSLALFAATAMAASASSSAAAATSTSVDLTAGVPTCGVCSNFPLDEIWANKLTTLLNSSPAFHPLFNHRAALPTTPFASAQPAPRPSSPPEPNAFSRTPTALPKTSRAFRALPSPVALLFSPALVVLLTSRLLLPWLHPLFLALLPRLVLRLQQLVVLSRLVPASWPLAPVLLPSSCKRMLKRTQNVVVVVKWEKQNTQMF